MSPLGPAVPEEDAPIPIEAEDEPIKLDDGPLPVSVQPEDDEPIGLVESDGTAKVKQARGLTEQMTSNVVLKRPLNVTGQGATRCRVFHSKIAVASLEVMEHQINEWLDGDEIEIKQVHQTIGTMQGKIKEENLIVTVWY